MKQTLFCGILLVCCLFASRSQAARPLIRSIEPAEGVVGQTITLIGENLQKTRSVNFLVGRVFRSVQFHVVSNTQLELTVPEYYRPNAEALILLRSDDSTCVTCPLTESVIRDKQPQVETKNPSTSSVVHVLQGGVVKDASFTTIVEKRGVVRDIGSTPLVLVKNGGIIGQSNSRQSLTIIYEPAARLSLDLMESNPMRAIYPVKEVRLAEGIGPFVYRPKSRDAGLTYARALPEIASISPVTAASGDILEITGSGFAGTTDVYAVSRTANPASFHVVSDKRLKIELPEDLSSGPYEIIVINDQGLTISRSPENSALAPITPSQPQRMFVDVFPGMVIDREKTNDLSHGAVFLIHPGGKINSSHGDGAFLVKRGGTAVAGPGQVFHEVGASFSSTPRSPITSITCFSGKSDNAPNASKKVDTISVSDIPKGLMISHLAPLQ